MPLCIHDKMSLQASGHCNGWCLHLALLAMPDKCLYSVWKYHIYCISSIILTASGLLCLVVFWYQAIHPDSTGYSLRHNATKITLNDMVQSIDSVNIIPTKQSKMQPFAYFMACIVSKCAYQISCACFHYEYVIWRTFHTYVKTLYLNDFRITDPLSGTGGFPWQFAVR